MIHPTPSHIKELLLTAFDAAYIHTLTTLCVAIKVEIVLSWGTLMYILECVAITTVLRFHSEGDPGKNTAFIIGVSLGGFGGAVLITVLVILGAILIVCSCKHAPTQ